MRPFLSCGFAALRCLLLVLLPGLALGPLACDSEPEGLPQAYSGKPPPIAGMYDVKGITKRIGGTE